MTFKEYIIEEIDNIELRALESYLDRLFVAIDVDVEFSNHFKERLVGREKRISVEELKDSFNDLFRRYKNEITKNPDVNSILKDLGNDINIPFDVDRKRDGTYELTTITIMKKKGFKPKGKDRIFLVQT